MTKRLTLFAILLIQLFVPATMQAVVWYTSQADGSADPNDKARTATNCFKHKDQSATDYIEPNTKYCRIYKYLANGTTADNNDNFVDPTLRYRLAKHFGYNPDGATNQRRFYITWEEAHAVTSLDLSATYNDNNGDYNTSIYCLQGLQIFTNLEELNLANNYRTNNFNSYNGTSCEESLRANYIRIPSGGYSQADIYTFGLPVSEMQKAAPSNLGNAGFNDARMHYMSYMLLFFPHLRVLNVHNTPIEYLHINNGTATNPKPIEEIDCGGCTSLVSVKANYTNLNTLDVTGCGRLMTLEAHHADLTSLDLTDNTRLVSVELQYNPQLTTITHNQTDVTLRPLVKEYDNSGYYEDYNNQKTGKYPFLEKIVIRDCALDDASIAHLENCPSLRIIQCQNNHFTTLDFHQEASLEGIWCANNQITSIIIDDDDQLHTLECQNNLLTSLDLSGKVPTLRFLDCSGNTGLTTLNFGTGGHAELHTVYAYNCALTDASNLNFSTLTGLKRLRLSNNTFSSLDLTNNTLLEDIFINNCGMSSITGFAGLTNLRVMVANNNHFSNLDFSGMADLTVLQLTQNDFTSLDLTTNTNLVTLFCDAQGGYDFRNGGRKLRVLKLNSSVLTALKCDNNGLLSIDLSDCPALDETGLVAHSQRAIQDLKVYDRNKVCIELPNGAVGYGDPNDDPVNYFYTWDTGESPSGFDPNCSDVLYRDGKYWLVVYNIDDNDPNGYGISRKADVDFYNKPLSYCYYTFFDAGGNPDEDNNLGKTVYFANNTNDNFGQVYLEPDGTVVSAKTSTSTTYPGVQVKAAPTRGVESIIVEAYPYIMWINPNSVDNHTTPSTPFHSGTIYLDYDAIVPAGTTAYIVKGVQFDKETLITASTGQTKAVSDQLELVALVPGEGATEVVIPARTAVYVKAADETGLFAFDRNNHGGVAQALAVTEDGTSLAANILQGTLTDLTVTPGSVFTLGRGQVMGTDALGAPTSESRIGFWPYAGTTVRAHRVYIPAASIPESLSGGTRGFTLSFNGEENVTGLSSVSVDMQEGWYTVSGVRLSGKPAMKGIYIHNGKKEVIR